MARPRRSRGLVQEIVDGLDADMREGLIQPGDKLPSEAEIMSRFDVSRTVVREAISKLQASKMVETRHGIGTFALPPADTSNFKIADEDFATVSDVIAVLELRIGVETEAAALAALRRTDANLATMREALNAVARAVDEGRDAVLADFQFHQEIARATQNNHFMELISTLGSMIIPRARLEGPDAQSDERRQYLRRVNGEHENIYDAIAGQDPEAARAAMRTHLANSRERRRRAQAEASTR